MATTSTILAFIRWVRSYWIPPHEVRREVLALGGRHLGQVLIGARKEAAQPNVPFRRAVLLRAVIRGERLAAKAAGKIGRPAQTRPNRR
jgi:hypothetical protein